MFPDRIGALFGITLLLVSAVAVGAVPGAAQAANGAQFDVEITGTNSPVVGGETLVVTATVTNVGDAEGSQQIHLKDDGEVILDSVSHPSLTLAPGESERVRLTWETDRTTESGNFSVQSNDDFPRTWVEIRDGAAFDAAVGTGDISVTTGENVTVPVTVTNDGNENGTTTAWLDVDGQRTASQSVELAPGESTTVDLTWATTDEDAGESTLTAGVDGSTTQLSATVGEPQSATGGSDTMTANTMPVPRIVSERSHALVDGRTANVTGHDVTTVAFDREVDGRVTADQLRSFPEGTNPVDSVVGIYRIDVPATATETDGTLTLAIDEERLGGADVGSVLVKHWDGESWTDTNTTATVEDGVVHISAETDSFSVFAVTTAGQAATPTATATATPTETATPTATATAQETATPTATDAPAPTDSPTPAANGTTTEAPGFGVVAALLASLVVALRLSYSQRN